MKRFAFLTSAAALAIVVAPSSASAGDPGILYVPNEGIDLVPTEACPIPVGGQPHSGLGCGGVSEPGTVDPYAGDLDGLVDGLRTALEPYDVLVTSERPPPYVPYFMLMPSDEVAEEGNSFTCTGAGINCGGRTRNDIMFTNGGTMNCMEPDPVHAALYAFGRTAGLEGTDDPTDPMGYVPDYTMPATTFQDACANLVQQIGFNDQDEQIMLPLECTGEDHEPCDMDDQQNSHADLLAWFEARTEDTDPPELADITPEDGAEITDSLDLAVTITDADRAVGVSWTINSPAIDGAPGTLEGGTIIIATNGAGTNEFTNETNAPDENWGFSIPAAPAEGGLPPGEYTITLEVADYHGNVADPVMMTVTIPDQGGADESGGGMDESAGDGMDDGMDDGMFTTGADTGDDGDDGGSDGGEDDDTSGCACTASPQTGGFAILLMGLFGLGLRRRD